MNDHLTEYAGDRVIAGSKRAEYVSMITLAVIAACLTVFSFVRLINGEMGFIPVAVFSLVIVVLAVAGIVLKMQTAYSLEKQFNVLMEYMDKTGVETIGKGIEKEVEVKKSSVQVRKGNNAAMDKMSVQIEKLKKLHLLKKQAEYHAHQSQINPHFLYNTLDTIRGKAYETGQVEVAEMIEALSRIFRYSLSNKNDMQRIIDEIENVRDYVSIQSVRFGNRFVFLCEIDENDWRLLQFKVPKLILQPLIENSLSHGLDRTAKGGKVVLTIYRTESQVIIRVEDNGRGIPEEKLAQLSQSLNEDISVGDEDQKFGIALRNINQRIQYIYGKDYGLSISSIEGLGTTTEIVMPYTED